MSRIPRLAGVLALLTAGAALGQCACSPPPRSPADTFNALLVEVDVEPGANDDSPIALSMLITHDRSVMEELLTLDATQWFARREQYLRDHEASIDEVMREYVPGQRVTPFWQRLRGAASEGVLFARYRAPGSHRYRFKATRPVRLVLGHSSVIVSNL